MGVYSGSALIGESSVGVVNNNVHVLDTLIESAQNEMNMFNAVINLDFMDAYNEAGIITLSEADSDDAKKNAEQSIGKKIKDFFKRVIQKIKTFVSTFIAKIQNLVRNDASLYKEYRENFNKNAEGYKLSKFRKLKPLSAVTGAYGDFIGYFIKDTKNTVGAFDHMTSTQDIDNSVEELLKTFKGGETHKDRRETKDALSDEIEAMFFTFDKDHRYKNEEDYELTRADVEIINEIMSTGAKKVMATIKKIGDSGVGFCTRLQKELKLEKPTTNANGNDLDIAVLNAKYKIAVKSGNLISKTTSAVCNVAARYVAAARRAFVVAGKSATEKKVSESYDMDMETYDGILGEASDIYVEKVLGIA